MDACAIAFANNDIAYIWWVYPEKIPECLGFSVRRIDAGGREQALPAFVGFEPGVPGQPHKLRDTDVWPIQAFQWKDVFARRGVYRYKVVPMLGPDPKALRPAEHLALETGEAHLTGDFGDIQAFFNVGLISTQAITKAVKKLVGSTPAYTSPSEVLRAEIALPNSAIRRRLAGQVINDGVLSLLRRAKEEDGTLHLGLYELADRQLIDEIIAVRDRVEVCLSNADSSRKWKDAQGKEHTQKIVDGTNKDSRAELHHENIALTDRFVPSSSIGHNKFAVLSLHGQPESVMTGSTNWTSTGLCSQTNNSLIIRNGDIAAAYVDYWKLLVSDAAAKPVQGADLRTWCGSGSVEATVAEAKVRVWFSPNTKRKTKDEESPPPDLVDVYELIHKAKKGVLFLAFNPGSPSCLEEIRKKAEQMREDGHAFYVRGAVTDPTPLGQFATFLTKRDALEAPDVLVTGVAGVPDDYSYWESELFKLGHAVIHDKIVVIDPFTPDCVVVTGSHNLGFKASYQNDENMVIVQGHERLAKAYAAHVLDVTNHFAWRSKLSYLQKQGRLDKAWGDLAETDRWQDKYFSGDDAASRDAFFFAK